jgi:hypothetical protein
MLGAIGSSFVKSAVFDSTGQKWQAKGIHSRYKRSWWTVLLANTVYNPWTTVTVLWEEPKTFALEELKQVYSKAVDRDDDILTQFVEAGELKKRISGAQSFEQLIEVYKWMQTDTTFDEPA